MPPDITPSTTQALLDASQRKVRDLIEHLAYLKSPQVEADQVLETALARANQTVTMLRRENARLKHLVMSGGTPSLDRSAVVAPEAA